MFSKNKAVSKRRKDIITGYLSRILFFKNQESKYPVLENFVDNLEKNLSEDFKIRSKIVTDNFLNKFIISNYKSILTNSLRSSHGSVYVKELKVEEEDDVSLFLYQNILNRSHYTDNNNYSNIHIYIQKISSTISEMIYDYKDECAMSSSISSFFLDSDVLTSETSKYEKRAYTKLKIILEAIQNKSFDEDKIMKEYSSLGDYEKIEFIDSFSDKESWFLSRLQGIKRGDGFATKKASIIRSAIANNVLENSIAENCAKLTKSNKREIADNLYHSLRRGSISEDMSGFLSSLITHDNTAIFSNRLLSILDKKTVAFLLPKLTEDFKHDYWMTKRLKEIIEN